MGNHLSEQQINGYIHRTLSDVERETIGSHINRCDSCRARLQNAEQWRRRVANDLSVELRYARPSSDMRFSQIQGEISRKRKFAFFRFHTVRMMGTVGKYALAILGIAFAMTMFSSAAQSTPLVQSDPAPAMFPEGWDDPEPYQDSLIMKEHAVLESLPSTSIYHLDMTISENLQRVFGRQQFRYVNNTGSALTSLYFSLLPNVTDSRLQVSSVLVDGEPVHHELVDDIFLHVELPYRLRDKDTAVVQMEFRLDLGQAQQMFGGALGTSEETISLTHFHPQLVPYHTETGWDLSSPVHEITNEENAYYRIRVNAPESLTIVTSGVMSDQNLMNNGQQNIAFVAGPVSSFYLIASHDFVVHLSETVGETVINSYAPSSYLENEAQEALDYAVRAVRIFNNQFGHYPFTELDVVGLSTFSAGNIAMGFPTVMTHKLPCEGHDLEQRIVTGVSEQWFMPIAAQSYQQNPWLADGLSEYATSYYYDLVDGRTAVWELRERWQETWAEQELDSIGLSVLDFSEEDYEKAMHGHTPLFLTWLEQNIGEETFAAFLRSYYTQYRWQGASANEFATLLTEYCDCDLSILFANASDAPSKVQSQQEDNLD